MRLTLEGRTVASVAASLRAERTHSGMDKWVTGIVRFEMRAALALAEGDLLELHLDADEVEELYAAVRRRERQGPPSHREAD